MRRDKSLCLSLSRFAQASTGALIMLMGAGAILLITVNASAQATNFRIPISVVVFNPCNGETVTLSGVDHNVVAVTLDGNGGFHLMQKDNIHVTGNGSLGNSYEGNQENSSKFNGRVGFEQTSPFTFSAISRGSAPNFEIRAIYHITVNHNGTVTVFFSNFTSACRG